MTQTTVTADQRAKRGRKPTGAGKRLVAKNRFLNQSAVIRATLRSGLQSLKWLWIKRRVIHSRGASI
jgi:hypothetical protein